MTAAVKYPLEIQGLPPERIIRPDGPKSKWVRVIIDHKKQDPANINQVIVNKYAAVINAKTKDIYRSDQKRVIAIKLFGLAIWTPITLIARTIYNIFFPVAIPIEIYLTVQKIKEQNDKAIKRGAQPKPPELAKKIIKVIAYNFLDIIKAPLYAVAMTIVTIGCLMLSPIKSDFLYEGRHFFGKMLVDLNHGDKDTIWTLAPCMQTIGNLNEIGKRRSYVEEEEHIIYDGPRGSTLYGLNNLAYSYKRSEDDTEEACLMPWLVQYDKAQKGHRSEKCWL